MKKRIDCKDIKEFEKHLLFTEKSRATIEKYIRDCRKFLVFIQDKELSKEQLIDFKQQLIDEGYKVPSINSMLAAINCFVDFLGRKDCKVKFLRCQRQTYMTREKELTKTEYMRLLSACRNNVQLNMILQTICSTGIRISELQYITVEAVKRGETTVNCKNKNRVILIPQKLQKRLAQYIKTAKIKKGPVFITKTGRPLDRSYIWKIMKNLCKAANVAKEKVFPHNLRKLFARTFYSIEKDIAKLADVLGHGNIETTRIYIMTPYIEHRRKIDKLGLII